MKKYILLTIFLNLNSLCLNSARYRRSLKPIKDIEVAENVTYKSTKKSVFVEKNIDNKSKDQSKSADIVKEQSNIKNIPSEKSSDDLVKESDSPVVASNNLIESKPDKTIPVKKNSTLIRVLLKEKNITDKFKWVISSESGFIVSDVKSNNSGNKVNYVFKDKILEIFYKDKFFSLNGRKLYLNQIMIIPKVNHISFENNHYHGSFMITAKNNKLYLVNFVDLEDYVLSVLPSESWPGWPKEVNKAFCICFRSYALSKILAQRKQNSKRKVKSLFDVKNTNIHQTYRGFKVNNSFKEAVEETRGIILSYNKQPVEAMFDSCCGGVIPSKIRNINFTSHPYLERSYPCTYCKNCSLYSWQKEYSVKELESILNAGYKHLKIRNVHISDSDPAGKVHEVKFKGLSSWVKVPGKKIYSLLKDIKSFCYKVEKRAEKVIFKGRGYGHHLGLCQWGAYSMIKSGWNYKDTLKFFYPRTVLMKLQTKDI